MAEEIPVYLFTGFMDSGKTSLIKDTIFENDFANGSKGLIIMCEDGDAELSINTFNTSLGTTGRSAYPGCRDRLGG